MKKTFTDFRIILNFIIVAFMLACTCSSVYAVNKPNNRIKVNIKKQIAAAGPTISYTGPQTYTPGTAITPLVPTSSGVAIAGYGLPTVTGSGFSFPYGVAVDAAGNVYVGDTGNNSVKEIPVGGGAIVTLGSGFIVPAGVAVDAAGNVYVADAGNSEIKEIPAGNGTPIILGSGFKSPGAVAVDALGNIYVADIGNNAIKKIPAGNGTPVVVGSGFSGPVAVAVDAAGNIYVADYNDNEVKEILISNGATFALISSISHPLGVAVDASGYVYASSGNSVIKVPAGGGTAINVGTSYSQPGNIAVNGSGIVYVADRGSNQIKKSTPVGGFYLKNALPLGLSFDINTGTISGTPVTGNVATNYTITAYNGNGGTQATLSITVLTNIASLLNLALGSGTLSPAFSSTNLNYSVTVLNGVTSIALTPTPIDPKETITVNGKAVAGGTASSPVALTVGSNPINVVVISKDGTATLTYTVTLTRQPPPPVISYSGPQTYTAGTAITPLVPASSGVSAPGYGAPVSIGSGFHNPYGVALDAARNLYITDNQSSTLFKLPPGGNTPFVLSTGRSSIQGVATDKAGNVFFTSNASIYEFAKATSKTTVYAANDGATSVAVDSAENIYYGGFIMNDYGPQTYLYRLVPAGYSEPVNSYLSYEYQTGIAVDPYNNFYVASASNLGFTDGVFKFPPNSSSATIISALGNSQQAVALDAATNLYVASENNTVTMDPANGGSLVNVGSGYSNPTGLAADGSGIVYIADNGNGSVKKVTPVGGFYISPALPPGLKIDNNTGIISGTPTVSKPATIYTITAYNSYGGSTTKVSITANYPPVPTLSYNGPQVYTAGTAIAPLVPASTGVTGGYNISPALPTGLNFDITTGIISGTPIVSSPATNYTITAFSLGGSTATTLNIAITLPPPPVISYSSPNVYAAGVAITPLKPGSAVSVPVYGLPVVIGAADYFNGPDGVAVDGAGNIYIADIGDNVVKKIPVGGGTPVVIASGFKNPSALAVDTAGNVYVADSGNNEVKEIPVAGGSNIILGSGFNYPRGIAVDKAGNIYVADNGNSAVKMIPSGSNTPVSLGYFPGPQSVAVDVEGNIYVAVEAGFTVQKIPAGGGTPITLASGFGNPTGVAVDVTGNVYVADYNNNELKEIPVGSGIPIVIGQGFNGPLNIAVDAANNLYLTDYKNNQVKELIPAGGYYISALLPAGLNFDPTKGIISGTPLKASPATTYKIYAYNPAGSSSATVSIAVTGSSDASLANIKLSSGAISPAFSPGIISYVASVGNGVSSITLTPTAGNVSSIITVNGTVVASGVISQSIPLVVGPNTVTTFVTASDGTTTRTYTVTITRAASSSCRLSYLSVTGAKLSPAFNENTTSYSATVVNATNSIIIYPTTIDPNATIAINGTAATSGAAFPYALAVGLNTINIVVTAQNGINTDTYTLLITREAPTPGALNRLFDSASVLSTNPPNNSLQPINDDGILVHQGLSPNGDGINDFLQIDGITNYPDNKLMIINRSGQLIFEARNYDNLNKVFDGHSNKTGAMQLPGTYYYMLDYTVKGIVKHQTGFIVIKY